MISQTISHYRILKMLGAGGMGEVYLAQDTHLERVVALKILPREVASDSARHRRFLQEARAASALNHPNVAHIYEIGEADGISFIAMEYIEGQTLDAKIGGQPLSVPEIVDLGIQLADALEEAHSKHIIHRDIKPSNIVVTERGRLKVLDFGLAKVTRTSEDTFSSRDDTQTRTQSGMVVGTVSYMSPEQALGEELDTRSDIFSMGVVLYEMATGKPPFKGATTAITFDAILNRAPSPPSESNPELPPQLEQVINSALEKDPTRRYQTAGELQADLRWLKRSASSGLTAALMGKATRLQLQSAPARIPIWVAVIVIAAISVGLWLYFSMPRREPPPAPMKAAPFTSFPNEETEPAFSPDGNQLAFSWNEKGGALFDIYVKMVGAGEPLQLTTHRGSDISPAWSPDGRSIAFIRVQGNDNGIYTTPALRGAERKLVSLTSGILHLGLDWSPDGKYLVFADQSAGQQAHSIFVLSVDSLESRRLTSPPPEYFGDSRAALSRDGHTVAFVRQTASETDIYVVPFAGGEPKRLTFDNRQIIGLAWTADGRGIVFSSNREGSNSLWRIPSQGGKVERLEIGGEDCRFPAISRQGSRLAYMQVFEDANIWRIAIPGASTPAGPPTKLIASTRFDGNPQFSPDGNRLVFESDRLGSGELWVCDKEGSSPVQIPSLPRSNPKHGRWSPDGRQIAFDASPEGPRDIFVVSPDGGLPRRITSEPSTDMWPSWSRDGKSIYFASDRSGTWQVWKTPVEGGQAVQVTRGTGFVAQESPDGRMVYYAKFGATGMWSVPAEGGEETQVFDSFGLGDWGRWAMSEKGIYFLRTTKPDPYIGFFSFVGHKVTRLSKLDSNLQYRPGLGVSPDDRWLLYTQVDYRARDLMLVENFR